MPDWQSRGHRWAAVEFTIEGVIVAAFGVMAIVGAVVTRNWLVLFGAVPWLYLGFAFFRVARLRRAMAETGSDPRVQLRIVFWGLSGLGVLLGYVAVGSLLS